MVSAPAMTTEPDFLTRDIPGPAPYGRAVFAVAPMIDWTPVF
jgi:tRNA-dihydrouridine synthase A